ncbi:nicotinamide N-methyltransferase-like [Gastrophryne carolinensis]
MELIKDLKCYDRDAFDEKLFVKSFFYPTCDKTMLEELVGFPVRMISKLCMEGKLSGRVLMDASVSSLLFQLVPCSEFFSEVTILEFSESSLREIEAWRNKEEGALDWQFASEFSEGLKLSSDQWREKEDALRCKIKKVSRVDFRRDNPADLPKADCLLCMYLLIPISKDYPSFCHNIRMLASLLNPGGVLLLAGVYNATFYYLGEEKFFLFSLTEDMLMKALKEAGLTVQCHETLKSKVRCNSTQYEKVVFLKAIRE